MSLQTLKACNFKNVRIVNFKSADVSKNLSEKNLELVFGICHWSRILRFYMTTML